MVARILDAQSADIFRESIQQLQTDVHDYLHPDEYTAWTTSRPTATGATWDDGTAAEEWVLVGGGTGKLSENGQGGPVASEIAISVESPYRFRTLITAPFVSNITWLVINGDRLFRVQAWKPASTDKVLANAYLEEVFGRTLPAVTP